MKNTDPDDWRVLFLCAIGLFHAFRLAAAVRVKN